MRTAAWAMAVALLITASRSDCAELACDAAVVTQAWDLLKLARYGQSNQERAAFVMRDAVGQYSFRTWHYRHEFWRATYRGVLPLDTVAIIHTHPNSTPIPSIDDEQAALRTSLPVYVVTRTMICRTVGNGVERLLVGDWNPDQPHPHVWSICRASLAGSVGAAR